MRKILTIITTSLFFTFCNCQNSDIKSYTNSTIANEPTLKLNSKIQISKSQKPRHNDYVAYNYKRPYSNEEVRIHKLIAMENDTLEIVDGVVFINKTNIDSGRNLIHFYKIPKSDYLKIKKAENISNEFYAFMMGNDSVKALLEDSIAEKYNFKKGIQIQKTGITDKSIESLFMKSWNQDNFGPIVIPKNKIFVIGDNRHNSEDSRYIGLIDVTNIFGVVIQQE